MIKQINEMQDKSEIQKMTEEKTHSIWQFLQNQLEE